jgi:hypothetical protein
MYIIHNKIAIKFNSENNFYKTITLFYMYLFIKLTKILKIYLLLVSGAGFAAKRRVAISLGKYREFPDTAPSNYIGNSVSQVPGDG